ncbi:MAG: Fpg/Nei family DNA glycosylase [Thermoanaerobaculia bacterium]
MPEGNSIHRFAREHTRDFGGRSVRVSSPQGRFVREARRLDGRIFQRAEARGKHLFHHWEGGLIVHLHLGMFGWFYRRGVADRDPRPTVRMRLSTREVTWDLIGPPTSELVTAEERGRILARLGPDPLGPASGAGAFARALVSNRKSIGDALLDQRVAAGVGNIYRAEALFLAGIHPLRPAARLDRQDAERLWKILRDLMRRGAREGRTATVAPEELDAAEKRSGVEAFYVYQQKRCRRCGSRIRRFALTGRVMYVCPRCQPRRPAAGGGSQGTRSPSAAGSRAARARRGAPERKEASGPPSGAPAPR